jgi:hypothetical protein
MDDRKNTDEQGAAPQAELTRKVYEKPEIIYCAPLEVVAATCARTEATCTLTPPVIT